MQQEIQQEYQYIFSRDVMESQEAPTAPPPLWLLSVPYYAVSCALKAVLWLLHTIWPDEFPTVWPKGGPWDEIKHRFAREEMDDVSLAKPDSKYGYYFCARTAQGVRQPKALEDEVLAHLRSRKCARPGHDHRLGDDHDEHEVETPRLQSPTIRQSRGSWAP